MKIGIFGGCFNPPHKMHYEIVKKLIETGYIDKCIIVPTGNDYNKRDLENINDRINMIKIMIDMNNIEISDISKDINYQYTYQVLDYFKNIYPKDDVYFICGTDNLDEFETWQKNEYILEKYKLLVIRRNDDNIDEIMQKYDNYKNNIVISKIAQNLISSTMIRERIKQEDYIGIEKYINKEVANYIKKKRLYKN